MMYGIILFFLIALILILGIGLLVDLTENPGNPTPARTVCIIALLVTILLFGITLGTSPEFDQPPPQ